MIPSMPYYFTTLLGEGEASLNHPRNCQHPAVNIEANPLHYYTENGA